MVDQKEQRYRVNLCMFHIDLGGGSKFIDPGRSLQTHIGRANSWKARAFLRRVRGPGAAADQRKIGAIVADIDIIGRDAPICIAIVAVAR